MSHQTFMKAGILIIFPLRQKEKKLTHKTWIYALGGHRSFHLHINKYVICVKKKPRLNAIKPSPNEVLYQNLFFLKWMKRGLSPSALKIFNDEQNLCTTRHSFFFFRKVKPHVIQAKTIEMGTKYRRYIFFTFHRDGVTMINICIYIE